METPQPVIFRLKKSFSWQTNYYKYPFYLAEANPNRTYTWKEVFTDIFKIAATPTPGEKDEYDWLRNVYGIEIDLGKNEVNVEGIGLIEKIGDDLYRISEAGIELGMHYAADPSSDQWKITFAESIARYDIRTRITLYYMSVLGYHLYFPNDESQSGFAKLMSRAQLISSADVIHLFGEVPLEEQKLTGRTKIFNTLLDRYPFEAVGPFIAGIVTQKGINLDNGIAFQGGRLNLLHREKVFTEPSTNKLSVYLKQTLSLFIDLNVITYNYPHRAWGVDYKRAKTIFSLELANDLFVDRKDELFFDLLGETCRAQRDTDGYINVRSVRAQICAKLQIPIGEQSSFFNRQVARLMGEGRLTLGRSHGWTAPASDTLFGDRSKEYVEFLF